MRQSQQIHKVLRTFLYVLFGLALMAARPGRLALQGWGARSEPVGEVALLSAALSSATVSTAAIGSAALNVATDIGALDITSQIESRMIDEAQLDLPRTALGMDGDIPIPFLLATGGSEYDSAYSVMPTADGGYIVAGYTFSYGAGSSDVLLLKYAADGTLSWSRVTGGSNSDQPGSVAQTGDGGYIVAGRTSSHGAGGDDILLLKYTADGTLSWARTAGGSGIDSASSVAVTPDGGYIVAGITTSHGAGDLDFLLLKYTAGGTLSWARTAGGSGIDYAASVAVTPDGGYIVAGNTTSYGAGSEDFLLLKYAGDGTLTWARTAGGSGSDSANSVVGADDGGYVVAGNTYSDGAGDNDVLLLKYAGDGTLSWARTAGGSGYDAASSIVGTADGGYVLASLTYSYGAGNGDVLLLKYAGNGALSWAWTAGGSDPDTANSVAQTADGGYILAGSTESYGAGSNDILLMKTNPDGEVPACAECAPAAPLSYTPVPSISTPILTTDSPTLFTSSPILASAPAYPENAFVCGGALFLTADGGSGNEAAYSSAATPDGGYIVAGNSYSYGAGLSDVMLLKYANDGSLTWARTAGGSDYDSANSLAKTADGGYVVAGQTSSYGAGNGDVLLLKYAGDGTLSWARTAGGSADDRAYSVAQTADGGYVVAGYTESFGEGSFDFLLLKYAGDGTLSWARTAGGSDWDWGSAVALSGDGGYVVAGYTLSYGSYDTLLLKYSGDGTLSWARIAGGGNIEEIEAIAPTADGGYILAGMTVSYGAGGSDVLLLKYAGDGTLSWARTAGGVENDYAHSVAQTADGGYIVSGETRSYGAGSADILLLKYMGDGTLSWARTAGGSALDYARSVGKAADGGYFVAGRTSSFGAGGSDVFLMRTDANGEIRGCNICALASPLVSSPSPSTSSPVVSTSTPAIFTSAPAPSEASPEPVHRLVCDGWVHLYFPLMLK